MDDGLLYENGKIRITKNVFDNGSGNKFVIANLKSVRDERIGKKIWPMIAAILCLALSGLSDFFPYSRYVFGGVGALLILMYTTQKEKMVIYVTNPQGEIAAFRTQSNDEFRDVSRCLKRAISLHR